MEAESLYSKREVRSFGAQAKPELSGSDAELRYIEGYAIVFNERSRVMYDFWEDQYFEEIIHPEAVTQELLERSDVKALLEHNRERLLARSNCGKGSLSLSIDDKGLKYRFAVPDTTDGRDALALIERGDLAGSSFGFYASSEGAVERDWNKERQLWEYHVRRIDRLVDVSITSDPAYVETSVQTRSLVAPSPEPEDNTWQAELSALRSRIPNF